MRIEELLWPSGAETLTLESVLNGGGGEPGKGGIEESP